MPVVAMAHFEMRGNQKVTGMAKVVLVDPCGWQGAVNGNRPYPNVGIAYLASMLRKCGHEVLVIDLNNETMTDNQVLATIDEYHSDIVCFSIKTATIKSARRLSQIIKGVLPNVSIILGGPHTTIAWRELVAEPWFDVIFVGEGEQELPTICHHLIANEPIEDIPGVVTKNNIGDDFILDHPLIADLDILPFPEYDLFPQTIRECLRTDYPLVTSRGCVYKCSYCSVPKISGRRFRKRSPANIIEELKWAQKKYAVTAFEIIDDVFNLDIERCKKICRDLIEENLGLTWSCPNGLRADRIDRELAELMYKSSCHSVMVGIESADPMVLASVNKGETIEDIERGIHIFKDAGINVGGYFIIGLPGDSVESQKRSVEFARKIGISAHFNMLVPYPGTELWEWTKVNARFLRNPEDGLHFADDPDKVKIVFETDDFPASERRRAYEMVHTRLERFGMLIPANVSRWQYHRRMFWLLWNNDRSKLSAYMPKTIGKTAQGIWRRAHTLVTKVARWG
jgi:anaerobic magnesium-protoporphyrin IX monomethyl ester cyclase